MLHVCCYSYPQQLTTVIDHQRSKFVLQSCIKHENMDFQRKVDQYLSAEFITMTHRVLSNFLLESSRVHITCLK